MNPIPNFLVCNPDERVRSLFGEAFATLGDVCQATICVTLEEGLLELRTFSGDDFFSAVFLSIDNVQAPLRTIDLFLECAPHLPLILISDFHKHDIEPVIEHVKSFPNIVFIQPPRHRIEIQQLVKSFCRQTIKGREGHDGKMSAGQADGEGKAINHQEIATRLQLSEEHYRTLVEDSFDTIFIHDEEIILFANRQASEMFGYQPDDFIGLNLSVLVHPDSLPLLNEQAQRRIRTGKTSSKYECKLIRCDGTIFEAEINTKAVTLDRHRIIQTWVRDISDRKRFEDKIILAKQEWERTFDSVPDLIGILNENFQFMRVNRALADRLGLSPKDALGLSCCMAYHNRSQPIDECPCHEVFAQGRSIGTTMTLSSLKGQFEITISPILDQKGNIAGAVHVAHDISDRQKYTLEREHSLAALTATLESTADGILVVAEGGGIQGYNQKFTQMWDIPDRILLEKNPYLILDYISPQVEDGDAFRQNIRKIAQQSDFEGLSPVRLKDGRVFEQYTQPQKIGREVVGRVWSFRDITARVKAENALRESEEKYRFIVEKSLAGIYIIQDGKFRFGNTRFYRMLGYDNPEEILNQPFWTTVHPQDRDTVKERGLKRERGEPVTSHYHFQAVKKDGSPIWLELLAERVSFLNRPAIIGTILDQTERKKAEDALKESEQHFRDIFDNISDIIYTHDMDGRLISVNRATCLMLGYSEDEIIGFPLWKSLPPRHQHLFYDNYISKLEKKGVADGVAVFLTKEGHKRYIEYRSSIVTREGQEPSVRGSARDVTDRIYAEREMKNLEEQLLQSQKMEAVGTLAGGIAHDFNNILTGIVGNLDLALHKTSPGHNLHRYLKTALTASERARDLTRHLLTISRKTDPQKEPMDIRDTIQETVGLLRQTIDRRIMLKAQFSRDLCQVQADATQMSQVLMNLCVNALDAIERDIRNQDGVTPAKTKNHQILISAENRVVSEKETIPSPSSTAGPYIVISVTDNGCGMTEETAGRIFEPFFTTKPMNKGTGLGLSTVYGIIKQHNGWVNVESLPGRGSTFHIYLPAIVQRDLARKAIVQENGIPTGHETILLVDDEDMIREFGQEFLEELGYRIILAKDGKEAIQVYEQNRHQIDLTILDMVMPHLSGQEVLDFFLDITPQAKVIISSGHFHTSSPHQRLESRPNITYMAKPYHLNELAVTIRQLLDHN